MTLDLATLIAHVESNDDEHAVRYEPGVHSRAIKGKWRDAAQACREMNKCSLATAQVLISCSWGAWQIMGFNLYAIGGVATIGGYLNNRSMQHETFVEYVRRNFGSAVIYADEMTEAELLKFAVTYNGPANLTQPHYVARIKQVMAELGHPWRGGA